jgi:fumarylacetoacetase
MTDDTCDVGLRSWVASANGHADFPIQNLPLGVFRRLSGERPRLGCAIGDEILDLETCAETGLLAGLSAPIRGEVTWNALMAVGPEVRQELRRVVSALLRLGAPPRPQLLVAQSAARMELPARIGDYTDFYASVHHATRVGALLRPDNPLLPNYKWMPIAYHGRASSIVISSTMVRRPSGQTRADGAEAPTWAPSRRLDYEAEVGFFVGPGNALGRAIPIADAREHLVGACLVNDWSARDVQKWEYQPLGPFLAKSFATTISPWIVTVEALAPFCAPLAARTAGDPTPLPYLVDGDDAGYDIRIEVYLRSCAMRDAGLPPWRISAASLLDMYWTPAQMLTHHASNGCNLRPGDLLASGTVSGPSVESAGCLLERTDGGRQGLTLPTGETRRFLEDGDEVVMRAYCERDGCARIGFGECRGEVVATSA